MRPHTYACWIRLAACVVVAVPLIAQLKPDFTGDWKMKAAESKLGPEAPRSLSFEIEHHEPHFKYRATGVDYEGEAFEEESEFTTDGKEHPGPASLMFVAHWEGEVLVVQLGLGKDPVQTVSMRLSVDGRQMIRDVVLKDEDGEQRMHQVFQKQQ